MYESVRLFVMTAHNAIANNFEIESRMREAGLTFSKLSRLSGVREHRLRLASHLTEAEMAAAERVFREAMELQGVAQ